MRNANQYLNRKMRKIYRKYLKRMEVGNVKKALVLRFLRTFLPQVPAVLTAFAGFKPEYTAILSLIGGLITTFDKWARENNIY